MKETNQTNALVQVIKDVGLEAKTGNNIIEKFLPFANQAEDWKIKAKTLVIKDASQTREMNMAREARLALRDIRLEANKVRIALKEDSLRYGKAVQGVYNVIDFLIVPIENHLKEQEQFVEIQEVKRKAKLKAEREMELDPYTEFVPMEVINLGEMNDEDYSKLLKGAKLQFQAKIDAEEKETAERIAKEKADADEKERIRLENEQLKKEAEIKEKQLAKEKKEREVEKKNSDILKEKAQKELDATTKANKELVDELKRKEDKEIQAIYDDVAVVEAQRKEQKDAEHKAEMAPDKEKLMKFSEAIDRLVLADFQLKSNEAKCILSDAKMALRNTSDFIKEKSLTI